MNLGGGGGGDAASFFGSAPTAVPAPANPSTARSSAPRRYAPTPYGASATRGASPSPSLSAASRHFGAPPATTAAAAAAAPPSSSGFSGAAAVAPPTATDARDLFRSVDSSQRPPPRRLPSPSMGAPSPVFGGSARSASPVVLSASLRSGPPRIGGRESPRVVVVGGGGRESPRPPTTAATDFFSRPSSSSSSGPTSSSTRPPPPPPDETPASEASAADVFGRAPDVAPRFPPPAARRAPSPLPPTTATASGHVGASARRAPSPLPPTATTTGRVGASDFFASGGAAVGSAPTDGTPAAASSAAEALFSSSVPVSEPAPAPAFAPPPPSRPAAHREVPTTISSSSTVDAPRSGAGRDAVAVAETAARSAPPADASSFFGANLAAVGVDAPNGLGETPTPVAATSPPPTLVPAAAAPAATLPPRSFEDSGVVAPSFDDGSESNVAAAPAQDESLGKTETVAVAANDAVFPTRVESEPTNAEEHEPPATEATTPGVPTVTTAPTVMPREEEDEQVTQPDSEVRCAENSASNFFSEQEELNISSHNAPVEKEDVPAPAEQRSEPETAPREQVETHPAAETASATEETTTSAPTPPRRLPPRSVQRHAHSKPPPLSLPLPPRSVAAATPVRSSSPASSSSAGFKLPPPAPPTTTRRQRRLRKASSVTTSSRSRDDDDDDDDDIPESVVLDTARAGATSSSSTTCSQEDAPRRRSRDADRARAEREAADLARRALREAIAKSEQKLRAKLKKTSSSSSSWTADEDWVRPAVAAAPRVDLATRAVVEEEHDQESRSDSYVIVDTEDRDVDVHDDDDDDDNDNDKSGNVAAENAEPETVAEEVRAPTVDAAHGPTPSLDEEPVDEGLHGAPERDADANESDPPTAEPETTVGVAEREAPLDGDGGEGVVAETAPLLSDHEESPPSETELGGSESAPPRAANVGTTDPDPEERPSRVDPVPTEERVADAAVIDVDREEVDPESTPIEDDRAASEVPPETTVEAVGAGDDDWVERVDPATNRSYYHNTRDDRVSWERPVATTSSTSVANDDDDDDAAANPESTPDGRGDAGSPDVVVEADREDADAEETAPDDAPGDVARAETDAEESRAALPEGWAELIDHASGTPYYYHEGDNVTTWERPAADRVDDAEIPEIAPVDASAPEHDVGATESLDEPPDANVREDAAEETADAVVEETSTAENESSGFDALQTNTEGSEAQHGSGASLPEGWIEVTDPSSNEIYYYNELDQRTTWDHPSSMVDDLPADFDSQQDAEETRAVDQSNSANPESEESNMDAGFGDANSADVRSPTLEADSAEEKPEVSGTRNDDDAPEVVDSDRVEESPLPEGWTELVEPSSRQRYYFHEENNVTTWERPTATPPSDDADEPESTPVCAAAAETSSSGTPGREDDVANASHLAGHERSAPSEEKVDAGEELGEHARSNPEDGHEQEHVRSDPWTSDELFDANDDVPSGSLTGDYATDDRVVADVKDDVPPDGTTSELDPNMEGHGSTEDVAAPATESVLVDESRTENEHNYDGPGEELDATHSAVDAEPPTVLDDAAEVPSLPDGWIEAVDPSSNKPYYVHEASNISTWDRPVDPVAEDEVRSCPTTDEIDDQEIKTSTDYPANGSELVQDVNNDGDISEDVKDENPEFETPGEDYEIEKKHPQEGSTACFADDEVSHPESEQAQGPSPDPIDQAGLPEGWVMAIDPSSNLPYYINEEQNITTWDHPVAAAVDEASETNGNVVETVDDEQDLNEAVEQENDVHTTQSEATFAEEHVTGENALEKATDILGTAVDDFSQNTEGNPERVLDEVEERNDDQESVGSAVVKQPCLPEGWIEAIDPASNMTYYFHEEDNVTTWDRPVMIASEGRVKETSDAGVVDGNACDQNDKVTATEDHTDSSRTTQIETNALDDRAIDDGISQTDNKVIPLPSGWIELQDPDSDRPYYLNEETNETTWDRPSLPPNDGEEKGDVDDQVGEENSSAPECKITSESDDVSTSVDGDLSRALPSGWKEMFDSDTGMPFYVNTITNESSWDRPVEESEIPIKKETNCEAQNSTASERPCPDTQPQVLTDRLDEKEPELVHPNTSTNLPEGWEILYDETTGMEYYFHKIKNITTWERPESACVDGVVEPTGESTRESPSRENVKEISAAPVAIDASLHSNTDNAPLGSSHPLMEDRHRTRPPCAIVSFGFGGRLCVMKPCVAVPLSGAPVAASGSVSLRKGPVVIHRLNQIVDSSTFSLPTIGRSLGRGPLISENEDTVLSYLQNKANSGKNGRVNLLWSLIQIAAQSKGRLRSEEGAQDIYRPESAIVNLLLRDSNDNDYESKCKEQDEKENPMFLDEAQEMLLRGNREGAVQKALEGKHYSLALSIAAVCDRKVYHDVCQRYINESLSGHSCLQTVTLMFSGILQTSSSSSMKNGAIVAASSFWASIDQTDLLRTWRNHLATILSNRTAGWESLVLALGDRLLRLGNIHASHFCYMVCGCPILHPSDALARLVMLGCDHDISMHVSLMTTDGIESYQMTEAFEWARRRGNPNAAIPALQPFKLKYAMLLADCGEEELARKYIESIRLCTGFNKKTDFNDDSSNPGSSIYSRGFGDAIDVFEDRVCVSLGTSVVTKDEKKGLIVGNLWKKVTGFISSNSVDDDKSVNDKVSTVTVRPEDSPNSKVSSGPVFQKPMELPEHLSPTSSSALPKSDTSYHQPPSQNISSQATNNFNQKKSSNSFSTNEPHISEVRGSYVESLNEIIEKKEKGSDPTKFGQGDENKMDADAGKKDTNDKEPFESQKPSVRADDQKKTEDDASTSGHKKGIFGSFKDKWIKKFNPDATVVNLAPDEQKPVYDEKLKRWIFPGDDPVEMAKPPPPPPKIPLNFNTSSNEHIGNSNNSTSDPLASLMSPPTRYGALPGRPSARSRYPDAFSSFGAVAPRQKAPASAISPPMVPPKFTVFQPKSSGEENKDD